jgi:hypothetical protein
VTCDAEIFKERLENNRLSDREIIVIEVYSRVGCPVHNACIKALNTYLIKKYQYQKEIRDPTLHEEDRRAQGKTRKKGWKRFWSSRF